MSKSYHSPIGHGVFRALLLAAAVWLCGVGQSAAESEEFLIDTWRFDDDLPRDGICSIAQGSDGYLWVSSRYGVARFDGMRFVNFTSQSGAQFLGHHFANLAADRGGTVWIGTPGGGLLCWRQGRLQPCLSPGKPVFGPVVGGLTNALGKELAITPDGRLMGWSNGMAELLLGPGPWGAPIPSSICQDQMGDLWFTTYQYKLVCVEGLRPRELVYGAGEERRNWVALQPGPNGTLWAGTQRGVGLWRGKAFEPVAPPVEAFPVDDIIAVLGATRQRSAAESGQGPASATAEANRLWVVALGRAWLLEGSRWVTNVPFEPSAGAYCTSPRFVDKEGNLWFTTTKAGLARAGTDGTLTLLTVQDGLPAGRVVSLYQDREGSIWAGIEHAGLARLRERYFTRLGTRDGTRAPLVWAVLQDCAGAIWLGTENNGLHCWQGGRLTQFNLGNGPLVGSVCSFCLDRQGMLWAGTGDGAVFRFENGKFVLVWELPDPGWYKKVNVIYEDHRGRMWFGTGSGLFWWDQGKVGRCESDFQLGVVRAMTEDASGRLWVGTSEGEPRLATVDADRLVARGQPEGLAGHNILGLHADADGNLWVGTANDGLWHWRAGEWSHYTARDGLPDERIYSIEEDKLGNLWLGSPAGILRLPKASVAALERGQAKRLDCFLYNRADGLPTRECSGGSQPAISHTRDGRLLFALAEGAVALCPDKVRVNPEPPPVLIEEVRAEGKLLEPAAPAGVAGSKPALLLEPGRHLVEFRYTATSLASPVKVRFKWRFDGVDAEWHEPDTARSAIYNLTAPGDYRFRVTACNNDGVWNQAGAAVALTVQPYVWQTWWFRVGGSLTALLVAGGTVRFIARRKLQRKVEQLERQQLVEQERARIARDIHDELGANLTEIGLLSEFAQRDSAPLEQVKADVQKIAAKSQSSTRALDEIVWAVNPRNDTVEGFVSYACAYAQEQLRLAQIRCRLEVSSPLPQKPLRADVRHHLFLAFKEALNNVVTHARASQVDIAISAAADCLTVSITDDGCGFAYDPEKSPGATGNGLVNMKARLQAVGGAFECQSAPGQGTRFKLAMGLA